MKITVEKSPKPSTKKPRKKKEFSKVVLAVVMIIYVAAAGYGGYITFEEREHFGEWLAFIGGPTAVAIGYYEWKAKNENVEKISKTEKEEDNAG